MTDVTATDNLAERTATSLERLEQARALGERIAALTPALARILEQLELLVAARSNANRSLLRAISDLADTESDTYSEAGR